MAAISSELHLTFINANLFLNLCTLHTFYFFYDTSKKTNFAEKNSSLHI